MARIRTIKPDFPQSESMGKVSRESRLCFILLFTVADDSGRLRGNSRMLASLLFPYDDDANKLIDGWLSELVGQNCIVRYLAEGSEYIQIVKWLKHQKIDKPSASKIPAFDEHSRIVGESSRSVVVGMDRIGEEGRSIEDFKNTVEFATQTQPVEEKKDVPVVKTKTASSEVEEVFKHWQTVMNHPKAILSEKTTKLITARLKDGFTIGLLREAIDGCSKTPHNMGVNDRNTRYDSLELILRDGENVNRFIANNAKPPMHSNKLSAAGNQTAINAMRWLEGGGNDFDQPQNLTEKEVFESKE